MPKTSNFGGQMSFISFSIKSSITLIWKTIKIILTIFDTKFNQKLHITILYLTTLAPINKKKIKNDSFTRKKKFNLKSNTFQPNIFTFMVGVLDRHSTDRLIANTNDANTFIWLCKIPEISVATLAHLVVGLVSN